MQNKEERMHLPKVTIDDFFTTQEEREAQKREQVHIIPIKEIYNFPNHPYQVKDDEEMEDMVNTVKTSGVIVPVIVRPKENGGYEMISGHRRKRACEIAGIKAIVREMTDEEAIIAMVDSNKQREKVLPSEKAFAYKMKLEALKKQGKRNDLVTSSPTATKLNEKGTAEIVGEEFGDGRDNVYRYIRLTELIPEILKLVDEEKMKLRPAVEISYLKKDEQDYVLEVMEYTDAFPSHPQARQMRKLSEQGELTEDKIDEILSQEKANQIPKLKLNENRFAKVLPSNLKTTQQKEDYIYHCVEETRKRENRQKQNMR